MPNATNGTCTLPSPAEIIQVGATIIPYRKKQLLGITEVLPTKYVDNVKIIIRRPDIIRGLQPWRGLASDPQVDRVPYNRNGRFCEFWPGYWGEQRSITEAELAMVAEPPEGGNWCPGMPLDARNEVARIQGRQTVRMLMRMEKNTWDALISGRYLALDQNGNLIHEENFNITHIRATVDWTDMTDSAPLATLRALTEIRTSSATFGAGAKYYMNRTTLNRLLENRNPNDIGKGSLSACCNTVTLDWINAQLAAQGLGEIVVYDNRYIDEEGGIHLFIPDGYVVVIGQRPDVTRPGAYYLTRTTNACLQPANSKGMWYFYHDSCGEKIVRQITIGAGHNGGPILEYPEMVISLQVF
jgi:hypothetical protein